MTSNADMPIPVPDVPGADAGATLPDAGTTHLPDASVPDKDDIKKSGPGKNGSDKNPRS